MKEKEYEKVHRAGVGVLPQPGGSHPVQFRMPQLPKPLQAELSGRDSLLPAVRKQKTAAGNTGKGSRFSKACGNEKMIHEIAADFHPIALVKSVNLLHGFVFFYAVSKNPFRNRKSKQSILDADIMGAVSIGSKSKLSMKEVFL